MWGSVGLEGHHLLILPHFHGSTLDICVINGALLVCAAVTSEASQGMFFNMPHETSLTIEVK